MARSVAACPLLMCRIIVERHPPVMIRPILLERYQLTARRRLVMSCVTAKALPPVIMDDIFIAQDQLVVRPRLPTRGVGPPLLALKAWIFLEQHQLIRWLLLMSRLSAGIYLPALGCCAMFETFCMVARQRLFRCRSIFVRVIVIAAMTRERGRPLDRVVTVRFVHLVRDATGGGNSLSQPQRHAGFESCRELRRLAFAAQVSFVAPECIEPGHVVWPALRRRDRLKSRVLLCFDLDSVVRWRTGERVAPDRLRQTLVPVAGLGSRVRRRVVGVQLA